LAIGTVKLWSS